MLKDSNSIKKQKQKRESTKHREMEMLFPFCYQEPKIPKPNML